LSCSAQAAAKGLEGAAAAQPLRASESPATREPLRLCSYPTVVASARSDSESSPEKGSEPGRPPCSACPSLSSPPVGGLGQELFVQAKAGHAQGSTTERYLHATKTTFPDGAGLAEARLFNA